jgi:hypothetical protein
MTLTRYWQMSYNGSGSFLINTAGQPVVSGTVISSTAFNALTADLATGLSTCITKDGQTTVTANIPMANYKFTGLGAGSAAADSANLSQVQSTVVKLLASVSGTDTITAVGSPTVASYAAGQMFYFVAAGDNTGAVTINIDSLGAKAVTRDGSVALAAGDIKSGEVVVIVYDGTRFQVVSQLNSSGDARFANVSITSALNVGGVATFSAGTAAAPAITTTGDTNTGIFFPAADTIAFAEGGVEAMRIDSSANVGIGTASPGYRLTVSGGATSLAANQYLRFGAGIFASSDGSVDNYLFTGSTALRWRNSADNAELMQLTNTGNLGLGVTPVPYTAGNRVFHIDGGANPAELRLTNNTTGTSGANGGLLTQSGNDLYLWNVESSFISFGTGNQEKARITSGGNLLVGTSTDGGYKLEVNGNAYFSNITMPSGGVTIGTGSVGSISGAAIQMFGVDSGTYMNFNTNGSERARITSGGDFLVGVTTGTYGSIPGLFTSRSATSGSAGLFYTDFSGDVSTSALNIGKFDNNSTTSQIFVKFGINDSGNGSGQINANGAGAAAFGSFSDRRLKENIVDLSSQWENLKALRPVEFDYIKSEGGGHQIGFIAQEVEEVYPDLVGKRGDEMLTLAGMGKGEARLIKALQEAMARIEKLEAEVAALKGA